MRALALRGVRPLGVGWWCAALVVLLFAPDESRAQARRAPAPPIVAAFYVNWDPRALASLRTNIARLDWVVGEWGFVAQSGELRIDVDARVLALARRQRRPPQLHLLVTNYIERDFDPDAVRRLAEDPARRRAAIDTLVTVARRHALAGVMLDFERLSSVEHPLVLGLMQELRVRLAADGRQLSVAIPGDDEQWPLGPYGATADYLMLMLYDEHDAAAAPGPIASAAWHARHLRRMLAQVPARQTLVGVGAYAYRWADSLGPARELTVSEARREARAAGRTPVFDPVSRNPLVSWRDSTGTLHRIWYLDRTTAAEQLARARAAGSAGVGVWRLGSEDPGLWRTLRPAPSSPP